MSTATAPPPQLTPADLLAMPDADRYELVDGELVELSMSHLSSLVAARMIRRLGDHCEPGEKAWVFGSDAGYHCFPGHPMKVRRPDVSVILSTRLPSEKIGEGYSSLVPDLVVEVISPGDLAYEVSRKIEEYSSASVPLIWVVYPETKILYVHRLDGTVSRLREFDHLSGEDVLPGFSCTVGELFPPASSPAAPEQSTSSK